MGILYQPLHFFKRWDISDSTFTSGTLSGSTFTTTLFFTIGVTVSVLLGWLIVSRIDCVVRLMFDTASVWLVMIDDSCEIAEVSLLSLDTFMSKFAGWTFNGTVIGGTREPLAISFMSFLTVFILVARLSTPLVPILGSIGSCSWTRDSFNLSMYWLTSVSSTWARILVSDMVLSWLLTSFNWSA